MTRPAFAAGSALFPALGRGLGGNGAAAGLVLLAVLVFSVVPLLIAALGGVQAPLFFIGAWRLGVALGSFALLAVAWPGLFLSTAVWRAAFPMFFTWFFFFGILHSLEYGFVAGAARYLGVTVSAVLFELWPIMVIALTGFLFRGSGRYRRNFLGLLPFLLLGFAGVALVVLSSSQGLAGPLLGLSRGFLWGLALIALSVVCASFTAFDFRWGSDFAGRLVSLSRSGGLAGIGAFTRSFPGTFRPGPGLVMFGVVFCLGSTSGLVGVFGLGAGLAVGESISLWELLFIGLGGFTLHLAGVFCMRLANVLATNLGVNALAYLTPGASLLWLAVFSELGSLRLSWLLLGTFLIGVSNLFMAFDSRGLARHRSLALGLGFVGLGLYLGMV